MKNDNKMFLALCLSVITLLSIAMVPGVYAINASAPVSPQEQTRRQIENGYNTYLHSKNINPRTINPATYFSQFLQENPTYSDYFKTYINSTKPDINKVFGDGSINPMVPSKIDAPFKIVNTTINGKETPISYSNVKYPDGSTGVQIKIGCGEQDPELAVKKVYEEININGVPIVAGEIDYLGLHFFNTETNEWKYHFDEDMNNALVIGSILSILFGLAVVLTAPSGVGPALTATAALISATETGNVNQLKSNLDNAIHPTYGLYYAFANTYIYSPYTQQLGISCFQIYGRHFDYDGSSAYELAYPYYSAPWGPTAFGAALSWQVSRLVNQALSNGFEDSTWYPCQASWPLPTLPSPGPTGLLTATVQTTYGSNPINANVYVDGYSSINSPSIPLIPDSVHRISAESIIPTTGGYYVFNSMTIGGNTYYTNGVDVSLSANTTISVDYTFQILYDTTVNVYLYDINYPYFYYQYSYVLSLPAGWNLINFDDGVFFMTYNYYDSSYLYGVNGWYNTGTGTTIDVAYYM